MAHSLPAVLDRKMASAYGRLSKEFDDVKWTVEKNYFAELYNDPETGIRNCSDDSIRSALSDAAFSGLSLSPNSCHAYIIPWKGKAKFTPSYRGLEHMVLRAGTVRDIQTVTVYANDFFRVRTVDGVRTVDHEEKWDGARGKMIAVYCIANYVNGGRHIEVMGADAIEGCKQAAIKNSRGKTPFTWANNNPFLDQMWQKCAVRRAAKHWPKDNNGLMDRAMDVMNRAEPMDFGEPNEAPDSDEPVLLISDEQKMTLHAMLVEGGLDDGKAADVWLQRMSEAMGHKRIDDLPAADYDDAHQRLAARLKIWRERQA